MEKIKALRDKTGAGIVDCKKALEESGGDIEKAVEILRKKGIAKAAKRSDRDTSEGIIKISTSDDGKEGYMVEINSETDFVARNEKFQKFCNDVLDVVMKNKPASLDDLFTLTMQTEDGEKNVKNELNYLSGVIGEKLGIKRVDVVQSSGSVAAYSHMEGRIGVLVAIDKADSGELARDIAMQVAAANPKYITSEEVPQDEIDKEKSIYKEQLLKEKKPENIIEKIMEGKINKYFEDVCLIKQEYIKDDSMKVADLLGEVSVEKFVRYSL